MISSVCLCSDRDEFPYDDKSPFLTPGIRAIVRHGQIKGCTLNMGKRFFWNTSKATLHLWIYHDLEVIRNSLLLPQGITKGLQRRTPYRLSQQSLGSRAMVFPMKVRSLSLWWLSRRRAGNWLTSPYCTGMPLWAENSGCHVFGIISNLCVLLMPINGVIL